jgi:hypothetical protein
MLYLKHTYQNLESIIFEKFIIKHNSMNIEILKLL